jgi:heme exporter protein B
MMPILFLPTVVPVVIAAVKATEIILTGKPWADMIVWINIIIAFDVIYLVVSTLVFEHVIRE